VKKYKIDPPDDYTEKLERMFGPGYRIAWEEWLLGPGSTRWDHKFVKSSTGSTSGPGPASNHHLSSGLLASVGGSRNGFARTDVWTDASGSSTGGGAKGPRQGLAR
jgi:hypothetical protein